MSMPLLDEWSLTILKEERSRLEDTYRKCTEAFWTQISPSGAEALDRITHKSVIKATFY